MKRFVLSTLVILCLSTMGYSQFEIGVKAGINSTELASTDIIQLYHGQLQLRRVLRRWTYQHTEIRDL